MAEWANQSLPRSKERHLDEWKLPPVIFEEMPFLPLTQLVDWYIRDLGISDLWADYGRGDGITVAVLDTGQPDHLDLIEASGKSKDFTGSARGVRDFQGHAQHVGGIIGARDNEAGTVGVAPKCTLMFGKVLGDSGSGGSQGIAAGIDWAVENGADVISMSLGSPMPSPDIKSAVERVPPHVVLCCAAGNSGPVESTEFPAAWERAISVGSTNQLRQVSRFSSRNIHVDIAAPGEKITSCYLGNTTVTLSGTSMACPVVAGLAALAKGFAARTNRPVPGHDLIAQWLRETADDIAAPGVDTASGWGLINPRKFLERVKNVPPVVTQPPVTQPPITLTTITVAGTHLVPGTYRVTPN